MGNSDVYYDIMVMVIIFLGFMSLVGVTTLICLIPPIRRFFNI